MLNLKGVGPTVIKRLEGLGYKNFEELRDKDPRELANEVAEYLGSPCWRNSPLARAALERIIVLAEQSTLHA